MATGLALFVWHTVKRSYSSEFVDATWAPYRTDWGHPVAGRITGWAGRPEVGLTVEIKDDAGTNVVTTTADGRFGVAINDTLRSVTVVGIDTIPLSSWNVPSGSTGVTFDIHLKRPPPPSRGPL